MENRDAIEILVAVLNRHVFGSHCVRKGCRSRSVATLLAGNVVGSNVPLDSRRTRAFNVGVAGEAVRLGLGLRLGLVPFRGTLYQGTLCRGTPFRGTPF